MKEQNPNTKHNKGITLIALIITIVVLLILAMVTIGAIKDSKIIEHAQTAKDEYIKAQENEQLQLALSEWQIQKNIPGNENRFKEIISEALGDNATVSENDDGTLTITFETDNKYQITKDGEIEAISSGGNSENDDDDQQLGKAIVGKKVSKNSTINGEAYSSDNPIIPAGFMAVNITTAGHESYWDAEDGPQVSEGLVISDGTSEFVWIPVPEIDAFARLQDGSSENYRGVLYNWKNDSTGNEEGGKSAYDNTYEPRNIEADEKNMSIWTSTLYQESFNKMVKSVAKYGGFYVGRYETSMSGNKAQSKSGETPMTNINWYRMYENSLTYSINATNLNVVSEMIWGCQWSAILKFILTGNEKENITAESNTYHRFSEPYKTGGTDYNYQYTEYNDISSNIYDLEGNMIEYAQTYNNSVSGGKTTYYRLAFGGDYKNGNRGMIEVGNTYPTNNIDYAGSRLALYVTE